MHRLKDARPSVPMVISIIALIAALGGTGYAATKLTTKDLANGAVTSAKVKDKTLKKKDLSKKARNQLKGETGPQGAKGDTGPQGPAGQATYTNPNWAVIDRNTEGSSVATLAGGPYFGTTAADGPPLGVGSLHIETADGTEKAAFGNQVDFAGDPVSGLTQLGFSYTQTGEDWDRYAGNLPNITLEINPSVGGKDYTSMVYVPASPARSAQQWITDDADANPGTTSGWWFSNGTVASATGCTQATYCTLAEAEAALAANNDGGPAAQILTLGIGKGKDYQYQGSVDALRVNDTLFDFEPFGVEETPAS